MSSRRARFAFLDVHAWTASVSALFLHVTFFRASLAVPRASRHWANTWKMCNAALRVSRSTPARAASTRGKPHGKRRVAFVPGEHGACILANSEEHRDFRYSSRTGRSIGQRVSSGFVPLFAALFRADPGRHLRRWRRFSASCLCPGHWLFIHPGRRTQWFHFVRNARRRTWSAPCTSARGSAAVSAAHACPRGLVPGLGKRGSRRFTRPCSLGTNGLRPPRAERFSGALDPPNRQAFRTNWPSLDRAGPAPKRRCQLVRRGLHRSGAD